MTENALKCQFNGGGVTIGYTVDENKNYHLDPLVAPFVKDAFEMYAGGKTVKEIVTYLNGKGVRSFAWSRFTNPRTCSLLNPSAFSLGHAFFQHFLDFLFIIKLVFVLTITECCDII